MPSKTVQCHLPQCVLEGPMAPSRGDWVLEKGRRETTVSHGMAPLLVINGVLFPRGPLWSCPGPECMT